MLVFFAGLKKVLYVSYKTLVQSGSNFVKAPTSITLNASTVPTNVANRAIFPYK